MQKLIALLGILLLLGGCAMLFKNSNKLTNDPLYSQYQQFQAEYHKQNSEYRFEIFKENYLAIQEFNARTDRSYTEGVNMFTDLTQEEFEQTYLMLDIPESMNKINIADLPTNFADEIDWRTKGAVTEVKNQGSCGSCWSFSVTGTLEGASAIQAGNLQSFSEQQLVDCCVAPKYKCQGCSGAWPDWALDYVKDNGITTEDKYPYKGYQQKPCKIQGGDFHISSYAKIAKGKDDQVKSALFNVGPVSICADASRWSSYRSGIFNNCGRTPLNHAILLVGYTADYWIVKNSWGPSWGEKGYIRLSPGNTCGLADYAITVKV